MSLHSSPNPLAQAVALREAYMQAPSAAKLQGLHEAIRLYRGALCIFTERFLPNTWAEIQNELALAYSVLPTDNRTDNLRQAISCFQATLRIRTERNFPHDWALTQSNIASAYQGLPTDDRAVNLQLAISHYQAALRILTESDFSYEWAGIQHNLAAAYANLPTSDRAVNLKHAIACYQAALRVRTEHEFPMQWANTQNNLAIAYIKLPSGDLAANLQQAITCCKAALRIWTERDFPTQWAHAQNNLAVAHSHVPTGDRAANLKLAISHYQAALHIYTERDFSFNWAETQNNLANAYAALPTGDRAANLQHAITCYKAALRIYTELDFPFEWGATQNGLANAYAQLPTSDPAANLQLAITHYKAALLVRTESDFPTEWAGTQNDLAIAYAQLPTGDRDANLQQALSCFQAALRVRTPDQLPSECQQTLNNLGSLFFDGHEWDKALDYYAQGITVTEQIRTAALDDAGRVRIFRESALLFERAVVSAARTNRYSLALTLTERGKTRNLADHLWQRDVKPSGVLERDWNQYQQYLTQARDQEQRLSADSTGRGTEKGAVLPARDLLQELVALRSSIREQESCFAQSDPDYVPFARPLAIQDIVELAQTAQAVLVEFRITSAGTFVFLVGPQDKEVTPDQTIELPDVTSSSMRGLLIEWLTTYYRRDASWPAFLEQTTGQLYDILFRQVHERLRERYPDIERLILIPNQALNLLPLHACWWQTAEGNRRYLLDEYEISYTPSCQVLKRCLARERVNSQPAKNLFAVQNPDGSLPFADWEVEQVASLFAESNRLILKSPQATEAAVKAGMGFSEEKLFSCHGLFDPQEVEKSYLALHGEGILSVRDIVPLNLRGTWLVVMSACETGMTDFSDLADEYQGLPAAFLVAGAQTVVASLWAVNDFSTALLMSRFHENLYRKKMPKATALREAQCWLRDMPYQEAATLLAAERDKLQQIVKTEANSKAKAMAATRMSQMDSVKAWSSLAGEQPFSHPAYWAALQCIGASL